MPFAFIMEFQTALAFPSRAPENGLNFVIDTIVDRTPVSIAMRWISKHGYYVADLVYREKRYHFTPEHGVNHFIKDFAGEIERNDLWMLLVDQSGEKKDVTPANVAGDMVLLLATGEVRDI